MIKEYYDGNPNVKDDDDDHGDILYSKDDGKNWGPI